MDLSQRLHQHVSASHAAEEIVLDDDGLWDKCLTAHVEVWFERGAGGRSGSFRSTAMILTRPIFSQVILACLSASGPLRSQLPPS